MRNKHLHADYYVHDNGTVTNGTKVCTTHIHAPDGTHQVGLYNEKGKWRNFHLAKLVATAFIPNPNNLPCVWLTDRNKANCRADNLEWISKGESARRNKALKTEQTYTPTPNQRTASSLPWMMKAQAL